MSLSDCAKCWDTPCTCGYEFRSYSIERLRQLLWSMLNYRTHNEKCDVISDLTQNLIKEKDNHESRKSGKVGGAPSKNEQD